MRYSIVFLIAILFQFSCDNSNKSDLNPETAIPEVLVYDQFDQLAPKFFNNSDTTFVINFWATSCPPCIKEMPHFNELHEKSSDEKTKIVLVSLDLARDLEKRVIPFVERHNILPEVNLLGDQNYSAWTDKIDSSWYGALPATLIVKGDKRDFSFGAFETYDDLMSKFNQVF